MHEKNQHIDPIDSFYKEKFRDSKLEPKAGTEDAIFNRLDKGAFGKGSEAGINKTRRNLAIGIGTAVVILALLWINPFGSDETKSENTSNPVINEAEKNPHSDEAIIEGGSRAHDKIINETPVADEEEVQPLSPAPETVNKEKNNTTEPDKEDVKTEESPKTPSEENTQEPTTEGEGKNEDESSSTEPTPPTGKASESEQEKKKSFFDKVKDEKKDDVNELFE